MSKSVRKWFGWACVVVMLHVAPVMGQAANTTPEEEYRKSIKVNEDIQPLGETPFGENVSLYDGSLSFSYTDVLLKGTGPDIRIERTFKIENYADLERLKDNAFGDWDLNMPRISTIVATQQQVNGWMVEGPLNQAKQICQRFGPPPGVNGVPGDSYRHSWQPQDWWHGYQLAVPGGGSQDLLKRTASYPGNPSVDGVTLWPAVTKQHWQVGCLGVLGNDSTRDAFLGVSPDGTRYRFDYMVTRWAPILSRPIDTYSSVARLSAQSVGGGFKPMTVNEQDDLYRQEASIYARLVSDRFGNWVRYDYTGNTLTFIEALDGRKVRLTYEAGSRRVSTITTQPDTPLARTWTYHYAIGNFGIPTLTSITQPDGSQWTFNMASISAQSGPNYTLSNGVLCSAVSVPTNVTTYPGSITHPSGLTGTFIVQPTKRGRSNVDKQCVDSVDGDYETGHALYPNAWYTTSIVSKKFSGAGFTDRTWTYQPSPANESWYETCHGACAGTVWTDVLDPGGNTTRSIFSNRYDLTESRLLRTEYYRGKLGDGGTVLIRTEDSGYASPAQGPWPAQVGQELQRRVNTSQTEQVAPLNEFTIAQDGNWFKTQTTSFDAFAQPLRRYQSSNVTDESGLTLPGKDEQTLLLNNLPHWVLGLPTTTTVFRPTGSDEVSRNVYAGDNPVLSERWRFGTLAMRYAWWGDGTLASFADGKCGIGTAYDNCPRTILWQYKRGIPTSIQYPDTGKYQTVGVDDQGQVSSVTDQLGATTAYAYDAIGRLGRIDYPGGDATAWAPKVFRYDWVGATERGIVGNHWRRTATQGGKTSITYFDAMLQPVVGVTYGTDAPAVNVTSTFDWKGRKTFQSYPTNDPLNADAGDGTHTTYDPLDRLTGTSQDSELGHRVVTTTTYGINANKRVIDANGNPTDFWYQVFGSPSYEAVRRVAAPEGVIQAIVRDIYGNPRSITQQGTGTAVTKTMAYDSAYRLCRTTEPESGSEIMAYDGASNLIWSASGVAFGGAADDCGQSTVADADKTVRTYDVMNRVKTILPPSGTAPSTFTYDDVGNPATATLGSVSWTYGRNKLGLLTAEMLGVDSSWVWTLQYDYDPNGALRAITYPDGDVVGYSPNALGQPTMAGSYAGAVAYLPDGDISEYALGSGAAYSAHKNTRKLIDRFSYGTGTAITVGEDIAYDDNGNVASIGDWATSNHQRSKTMGYDRLNRLTWARADNLWGREDYTYDGLNNILGVCQNGQANTPCVGGTLRTYNYDPSNRLASISVGATLEHTFAYDPRGNTTLKDGQSLQFDRANRLVALPGVGAAYTYDAAGRRVKKVTPAGTTYYAYNSAGQLMWELDPATRLGSSYVYLGKKLIAKKTESIDILRPSQVRTALSIVGVPTLSANGTTVDVTLDISNSGTRTLSPAGQYPVQMGYHLVDSNGTKTQVEGGVNLSADITPGGHGTITMHVAAAGVLGTGKRIRFSLVQAGVGWFEDWANNGTVEAGPYSACPSTGLGHLCNNVTGLTRDQVSVALAITSGPSLSADGQSVLTTIDIANNGKVTLASASPHPVNLGNHLIDAAGNLLANDVTRASIPELAPGQHAAVTISTPASQLVGLGRRVQFELVQEGLYWFQSLGVTPLVAGPYATLGGSTSSTNGTYALSWQALSGATSYTLREQFNSGAWVNVSSGTGITWTASGKATGTYGYQVQACNTGGCAPFGATWTVNVLLPPPVPASATASAPIPGPITLSWAASATATRYVVIQQINGGGWTTVYDGPATSAVFGTGVSGTYVYQVQACNSSGCSAYRTSNAVGITLPPSSAPGISGGGTSINGAYGVSWSGVAGASTYNLIESANGGGWVGMQNTGATSWSTSGRGNGTYVYQVQACNAGGCGPWSGQVTIRVALPPVTPGGVGASKTTQLGKRRYEVHWNAVATTTNYQVERTITDIGTDIQDAVTTTSLTFNDIDNEYIGTVSMRVRACNSSGCSPWSGYVYVTF